jgi:hypothetical protein
MNTKQFKARDLFLIRYGFISAISNSDEELECMRLQLLAMYKGYA